MEIIEKSRNVHILDGDSKPKLFICSDVHWDSKKCDRELFLSHLKKAEKENRTVIINGDFFDLMQGRYDPRSGKYDIRPEYKHANYLDEVINDGAEVLSSFNLRYIITQGNHETNILKRLETNPIERLVTLMKHKGSTVFMGGYSGWIGIKVNSGETSTYDYRIKYHHGAGGGKRSKGVLDVDLDMSQNPDADMLIKGHDHNKWHVPMTVSRIDRFYETYLREVNILRTGSYKMKGDGFAGWSIERDFNQPRLGGWFIDMSLKRYPGNDRRYVHTEITEAK